MIYKLRKTISMLEWNCKVTGERTNFLPETLKMIFQTQSMWHTVWPIDQCTRHRRESSRVQGNINKTVVIKSTITHRLPMGEAFIALCHLGGHHYFWSWKMAFKVNFQTRLMTDSWNNWLGMRTNVLGIPVTFVIKRWWTPPSKSKLNQEVNTWALPSKEHYSTQETRVFSALAAWLPTVPNPIASMVDAGSSRALWLWQSSMCWSTSFSHASAPATGSRTFYNITLYY